MKGRDGISRALYVTVVGKTRCGCAGVHQETAEDTKSLDRVGTEARKGDSPMAKVSELHRKWMKKKEYRKAYEELAPEFAVARAVIDARVTAGLTREQLARRMDTTQSVIARLESRRTRPSTQTLERLAAATGTRLRITFEPEARL
jgi:ribosome-binding protein aMBF1 (putative translation factor)